MALLLNFNSCAPYSGKRSKAMVAALARLIHTAILGSREIIFICTKYMANYYTQNYGGGGLGRFSLFSPMIKSLIIANVAIYLLQLFLGSLTMKDIPVGHYLMEYFALQPIGSDSFFPWWQLVTYQFMHGGFFHLFFNMFSLWMFGSELESIWGGRRFLTFYLLCGIGAGVLHLVVSYFLGSMAPTVGASGSVYGLLLAFGFMFPDRPILMFPIFFPVPAKIFVLFMIGIGVISGITGTDSSTAHFAHLGGALFGYFLLRFGDKLGIFSFVDRVIDTVSGRQRLIPSGRKIYDIKTGNDFKGTATSSRATSWLKKDNSSSLDSNGTTQENVDRILDKIAATGYNSLSDEEKRVLNEASKKM
jgi:membrane associated rhomboid family serine protease